MTVNGQEQRIDDSGTAPVLQSGRTLLPVRAVIEAMGGSVQWDAGSQSATLNYKDDSVKLTIGSLRAYRNDTLQTLDVAPVIENGRTMLPIRFISESFGFDVGWDGTAMEVTISGEKASELEEATPEPASGDPVVYFTSDISPEGLEAVYSAMKWEPKGNVGVKISTGEPPNSNYLRTELIGDLVKSVNGTFVESNTAYGGSRASAAMHLQVAEDHGYTAIAKVDIQDAKGTMSLPVTGGTHLKEHIVGATFGDYDSYLVLSHFKGHAMAGFGGAIKNISIGMASSEGKSWIHTAGRSKSGIYGSSQDSFLESMGDAGTAVKDAMGENIAYVNVMNRLSVDCDCNGNPAEPDMHDIGILASTDPVALDQACIDLVYSALDGQSVVSRINSRNGLLTLEHAEKVGLGSRTYELVNVGE
ncbi:MAG: DUF362 domain-containing protein [Clostridiales bacterium]|nr:DUF362 domain-containing protein [Clostridiales bacterium]